MSGDSISKKAIVLGCSHAGLAITRSLGKKGLYVIGLTYNVNEFGLGSRYLKEWHICPHPHDEEAFINYLLSRALEWQGALIFETNDYFLTALSKNKDRLLQHYKLVSPDWETAQLFLEKDKTYELAERAGVPHPNIYQPSSIKELDALEDRLNLPVMIKPVVSHEFVKQFGTKLIITETFEDLRANFQRVLDANQPVVLSEIIPGTDYATLERIQVYINSNGELAGELSNIKLRQTPPMYGVMRVGKSTKPNDEVRELTLRLLKHIDYRGYASAEFKRDPRDNELKLMEVNIRQPRSSTLAISCGVDMPWLIYQDLVCNNYLKATDYVQDMYLIEFIADITDFVRADKNRSLKAFIQPYFARHKSFAIMSLNDPKPFVRELRKRGISGLRKGKKYIISRLTKSTSFRRRILFSRIP